MTKAVEMTAEGLLVTENAGGVRYHKRRAFDREEARTCSDRSLNAGEPFVALVFPVSAFPLLDLF